MHRSDGATRWLVAGVSALLLGLLGMYALGLHGTTAGQVGSSYTQLSADRTDLAGAGTHASASIADPGGQQQSPGDEPDRHGLHAMAGLCLATLAAGLLLLVATVARPSRRPWAILARRGDRPARRPAGSRFVGHGPPYVLAFSVIRC